MHTNCHGELLLIENNLFVTHEKPFFTRERSDVSTGTR